jgi:polyisoprenoid-binding protein YceI
MSSPQSRSTTHPPELSAGAWRLDPNRSRVEFQAGHLWGLGTVNGRFESYEGTLQLTADPAITLTIDAGSVQTGNKKRDQDLRSPHFFDADRHPYVRFVSETVSIERDGMKVRGRLHARGSSVPLEVDAQIRTTQDGVEIEASSSVSHQELGMTFNPARMIRPTSRLTVKGRLVPTETRAA